MAARDDEWRRNSIFLNQLCGEVVQDIVCKTHDLFQVIMVKLLKTNLFSC